MAAEQDEDLLDNWEEIDENPAVLEKRLEKLSVKKATAEVPLMPTQLVSYEDGPRTPFTSQEPKIMILRRPQERSPSSAANGIINSKQKQPVKSLEQRQQEYAQARLRILGDAGSAEESKPKPVQQKSLEQREADYAAVRLRIMGSSKSVEEHMMSGTPTGVPSTTLSPPHTHLAPQSSSVGVVRCPRGPDGTAGFGRGSGGGQR
ncbi:hypothetical protein O3P69_004799 [Scylla paramamosain]|uniref:SUZ RNA-binding domain-containing n=1 Tax=Scylla paramamosain TaxID=85552 RepID=A0AAW0UGP1_SCYPA